MKIFGREPTLVIQAISALLGVAVLTAVTTAINAVAVRPVAPAAFTGLVTAVAVLVAAYGLEVSQETVGAVQVAVVGVLALLTRNQVTPAADPRQSIR